MEEAELTDMTDTNLREDAPRTATSGRGRGRGGFGRGGISRRKAAANARKARGARRARKYDDPKVQAAWERMQELKAFYAPVASALKPILEETADRSLRVLEKDPEAHEAFSAFDLIQSQLDKQRSRVLVQHERRFRFDLAQLAKSFAIHNDISQRKFQAGYQDATERFYEGQLNKIAILEELHDIELPVHTLNTQFNYKTVSEDEWDILTKKYVYFDENGIEVPYPNRISQERLQAALTKTPQRGKRGAPIRVATAATVNTGTTTTASSTQDTAGSPAPLVFKHSSVLMETMTQGIEPSSEPSSPREGSKMEQAEGDVDEEPEKELVGEWMPKLPTGASEPDAFGVRTVNRKTNQGGARHNRIILPPLYEYEPHEIGFRDSTNDSSRTATERTRGHYLDAPNTPSFHLDPVCTAFDCTKYQDDDLDEEIVKKHSLHPTYGLFLNSSRNDREPPKPFVSGLNPTIIMTEGGNSHGDRLHLSRSVAALHVTNNLDQTAVASKIKKLVETISKVENLNENETRISQPELDKHREKLFHDHALENDRNAAIINIPESAVRLEPIEFPQLSPPPTPPYTELDLSPHTGEMDEDSIAEEDKEEKRNGVNSEEASIAFFTEKAIMAAALLLEASSQIEREQEEQAAKKQVETSRRQSISRPYDAVRDIFASVEDRRSNLRPPPLAETQLVLPPSIDVYRLSYLAEIAEGIPREPIKETVEPIKSVDGPPLDPMMFQITGEQSRPTPRESFLKTALNGPIEEEPRDTSAWIRDEYSHLPSRDPVETTNFKHGTPHISQPVTQETGVYEANELYPPLADGRDSVPPARAQRHQSIDSGPVYPANPSEESYPVPPEYAISSGQANINGYVHSETASQSLQPSAYGSYSPMPPVQSNTFAPDTPQITQPPLKNGLYEQGYGTPYPGPPPGAQFSPQYRYASEHQAPPPPTSGHYAPGYQQPSAYSPPSRRYSEPYGPGSGLTEPCGGATYQGVGYDRGYWPGMASGEQLNPRSGTGKRGESKGRGRPRLSNLPVAPSGTTAARSMSISQDGPSHPDLEIDPRFKRLQPKGPGMENQLTIHEVKGRSKGELRTIHYNHVQSIKDYEASEPPPVSGPLNIRGWNVNQPLRKAGGRSNGSNGSSPTEG